MTTEHASTHPRIQIIGEGHDQAGKRYFKLSVPGSAVDIPPFSMEQLVKPKALWIELNNAGANLFTTKAQNQLLAQLQRYKRSEPSFRVASRLGWDSGAFVLGNEIIGTPDLRLERSFRHLDHQMLAKYRVREPSKIGRTKLATIAWATRGSCSRSAWPSPDRSLSWSGGRGPVGFNWSAMLKLASPPPAWWLGRFGAVIVRRNAGRKASWRAGIRLPAKSK